MKRWCRMMMRLGLGLAAGCGWAGGVAAQAADYRAQYAEQWPLLLPDAPSAAYRVVLPAQVYQRAGSPVLADVQVFNAAGQALPSALLAPDQPLAQPPQRRELPWFALPPLDARQRNDLQLLTERDGDGRVRRVEARLGQGGSARTAGGWLVDASALGQQSMAALLLDWEDSTQPLQAQVQVAASDDLQHWRPLLDNAPLVDLQRAGKRLLQRRLAVDGQARYLRILPRDDSALPALRGVQAELPPAATALPWQWLSLAPQTQAAGEYTFRLDGRFPVARATVDTADNSLVQWTLYSRDDADAPWQRRTAPWVAYQLQQGQGGQRTQSAPQALASPGRDRYWKLVASPAQGASVPTLRLGYQPEVLVFLGQGAAPYALAVGSATAQRADAPVAAMIDQLRQHGDRSWQPAVAQLGPAAQRLAGEAALQPARDWKAWLLWALLGGGVLIVGGLALSLLRQKPATR